MCTDPSVVLSFVIDSCNQDNALSSLKEWLTYHALVHRGENITTLLAELVDKSYLPRREVRESELVQTIFIKTKVRSGEWIGR